MVQTGSAGKAASYALSIVNPGSQSLLSYQASILNSPAFPFSNTAVDVPSGTVPAASATVLHISTTTPSTAGAALAYATVNVAGSAFSQPFTYIGTAAPSSQPELTSLRPEAQTACTANSLYVVPMSPQSNAQARIGSTLNIQVLAMDNCGTPVTSGTLIASFSNGDSPVALTYVSGANVWTASWVPISSSVPTVSIVVNARTRPD